MPYELFMTALTSYQQLCKLSTITVSLQVFII